MTRDKYESFAALARAEREGVDYRVRVKRRASRVTIVAPHGGGIEPGSSQIAEAIAGDDFSFCCFEGLRPSGNRELHITSTRFDEPQCVALVEAADHVVAVHGYGSAERLVYMGGLDRPLRDVIAAALENEGFKTDNFGKPQIAGISPQNICNRGRRRKGVQLEISRSLRDELMAAPTQLTRLAAATRQAIAKAA
jgi:phage replication-related protein YjqB (UPF0714/DUF867 family)